jgi:signal transduction histidine kinase
MEVACRNMIYRESAPLYRGDNSKGISGAGIGLYVVDTIVATHNARLSVESSPGFGTSVIY